MGKKKSKYRPKGVNPTAHLVALQGVHKFDVQSRNIELIPLHAAVGKILEHAATKEDWYAVYHAVNMIEQLVRDKVLKDEAGWLKEVQDTMLDLVETRRACRHHEIALLRDVLEYFTLILDTVTFAQYVNAKEAIAKRKAALWANAPGVRITHSAGWL